MIDSNLEGIAIIGMAGRFPGAASVTEFWRNLVDGVESISTFSDAEIAACGIDVEALRKLPGYVAARGILKDPECFDANFFGMNPKEAEITDPQQRLFLEASWEALENAGYVPESIRGAVGVFAGMGSNTYYLNNVQHRPDLINLIGPMAVMIANEKDFLTTHVAYKLNLKGPAVNVNTACSTSLVAVCQAFQSLLNFQCDLALAGGVSVSFPQKRAFHYQEGGIISQDGHCRAFDARAQGTVSSDGLGIVVLKRLSEAVNDGDQIYAVIKGVGVNNDGSSKGSFTAPSVDGQAEVILQAQSLAGFSPETITYIEAHGTGTPLGDPIEVAGLTQAFRGGTAEKNFCAIGSVKSNIGHLDTAAGVTGLIKTALALKHKQLPASLFYSQPNPRIDFENSPFFVNSQLRDWQSSLTPRRAGVSSFGLGGTNAHAVLEEPPALNVSGASREWQLLTFSAKTESALNLTTRNFADHLKSNPGLDLADAAFTLHTGRSRFNHRRILVCRNAHDALKVLEQEDAKRIFTHCEALKDAPVVFMFPGQGAQYVGMGAQLYETEPVFRDEVDYCTKVLQSHLGLDLRQILFPATEQREKAGNLLIQTQITQPALFVTEYSLARLWMSWGIKPKAMIGHSVGEFVAACLAGVMTLDEALLVIATRARLIQAQPPGGMLAVRLPEKELQSLLGDQLSIAAINSPSSCVVSGPYEAIASLQSKLKEQGAASRVLDTSHAFHSYMMDPVLDAFAEVLEQIRLKPPVIPFVSNVTGKWIASTESTDPGYWVKHLRQTVRFAEGLNHLLQDSQSILLEVGPGQILSTLARQHPGKAPKQSVVSSLAISKDDSQDLPAILTAFGKLWLSGAAVDWKGFYQREKRQRLALPTYPFERKRFWIEPGTSISKEQPIGISPPNAKSLPAAQEITPGTIPTEPGKLPVVAKDERPSVDVQGSRRDHFLQVLKLQLQEFSGKSAEELSSSSTFLDMGLDSLLLAQVSQFIQRQFGIQIGFRQLMESVSSLSALADHLDKEVPLQIPGQTAHKPTLPESSALREVPVQAGLSAALIQIQDQLKELTAQVETLRRSFSSERSDRNAVQRPNLLSPQGTDETDTVLVLGEHAGLEGIESEMKAVRGGLENSSSTMLSSACLQTQPAEVKRSSNEEIIPLTQPQLELWLATLLGTEASRAFHQRFLIHLRGPLNMGFLLESLDQVVDRHDSLRATFMADGSGQRIAPSLKLNVTVCDLSDFPSKEEEFANRINPDQEPPFDLVKGPLFRAELFKISDTHHALLLVAHHIIMDGWSAGVILNELSAIYSARCGGKSPTLAPAMQFSEYVQWQNSSEYGTKSGKAEKHWVEQFANLPAPVELPSDRPRPAKKTYRAVTRQLRLEPALHRSLKEACQRQSCTLFNYLFGTFAVWIARFTGQSDLVIGIHTSGQIDAGEYHKAGNNRALVGHCVNLLPLRTRCDVAQSFNDYLQSLRHLIVSAYENQHCTLGSLVNKLNLPRDASRVAPLISMTFNLARDVNRAGFHGLQSEIISLPKACSIFDLTFDLFDSENDLVIECRFNNDLFDPDTIVRWLGHWRTLLQGLASSPNAAMSSFQLLSPIEQHGILNDWNITAADYPSTRCVHQLFEEQVKISPHAIAVLFDDQQLTYGELNQKANRLARRLKQLGVGAETLVAICMERSLEMLIGLLAIMKSGGAYVPLDPSYPKERIEVILTDAQASVILTQQHLLHSLLSNESKNGKSIILCPETENSTADSTLVDDLPVEVRSENLAYVLFTSGSTGRPKGVQITHQALVNFLCSMQREPGITSSDVLLAVTTLSFDIAGLELWLPLIAGARVVIARREVAMDGKQLAVQLEKYGATILQATPITWRLLLYSGWTGNPNLKVLCGGEAWGEDLASDILPRCKSLWNMYGPTETTIWSAATKVERPELPLIGRPIANTQFHVLDENLQPVPIGVPGELHIGGHGLARGYLRSETLTRQKFIPNPFSKEPGAPRLYKTGDSARYRPDGKLEFLGRIDNQVKIRGYRIELGEIEAVLRKHANVANTVVAAHELSPGNKSLVAYVVPMQKPAAQVEELKTFISNQLPEYMVPAVFVTLESLPLTPNGKVDRKSLPHPDLRPGSKAIIPPKTSTEEALVKIWCEVLGLKAISIDDNFFELGGNSLAATQLISRLRGFGQSDIELRDVFDYPTVAAMGGLVDSNVSKQRAMAIPKLVPLKRRALNASNDVGQPRI